MTSGGRERRTNWESVTLIRIYLNITWTQQGLRIGYFDFSQVHSRRYFSEFSQVHSRRYFSEFSQVHSRRYFSKFPRYTAGFIFQISQVHSRRYFPNFPRYMKNKIGILENDIYIFPHISHSEQCYLLSAQFYDPFCTVL